MKLAAAILAATLMLAVDASAATLYVSPAGSGTACSSGSPCTIQYAATVVNPGDVVLASDGVYVSASPNPAVAVLTIARGGTSTNKVTFKAINKWGAKIWGQGDVFLEGVRVTADYVRLEGFDVYEFGDVAIYNVSGDFFEMVGNHIHHIARTICSNTTGGFGGYYAQGPHDVLIEGNQFNDLGRLMLNENGCAISLPDHDHALYFTGDNVWIRNNIFYNIRLGWAVQIYGSGDPTPSNIYIENNTMVGRLQQSTKKGQITGGTNPINVYVRNNLSHQSRHSLFKLWPLNTNTGDAVNNFIDAGNVMDETSTPNPGIAQSGNILSGDPMFVSVTIDANGIVSGTPDFHLREFSPALDAGVTLPGVTTDFDGTSRPWCNGYDIGAHERVACPSGGCGGFEEPPCEIEGFSGGNGAGGGTIPLTVARERTDLYDINGRKAKASVPGVYFQRIAGKAGVTTRRVVVVR